MKTAWTFNTGDLDFSGYKLKQVVDAMVFKNMLLLDVRL